jgi:hypothetical protein
MYVGRIERSSYGYILKDKFLDDIYRVIKVPRNKGSLLRMSRISHELTNLNIPLDKDVNYLKQKRFECTNFVS